MYKILKRLFLCGLVILFCWSVSLLKDREMLNEGLIRFHVVAHSDSDADQKIKLQVRDAVLQSLQKDLQKISDIDEARKYLQENLPKIQAIANETLHTLGFNGSSVVSFCKEQFDVRHYDTFSLPAGIYDSLRIVIGAGEGKNWWCVSFPSLCLPATAAEFQDVAASAGFSLPLTETLAGNGHYKIRFFFLDALGKLENNLFEE